MEQLDAAVTIQEKLCDVPHEKLKSLQEKREIYSCLNLTDSSAQELQKKLEQCQEEMTREKKVNNIRLERIMDMANNNGVDFSWKVSSVPSIWCNWFLTWLTPPTERTYYLRHVC